MRLRKDFFDQSAPIVARALVGALLVHGNKLAIVIETEAYMAENDGASHIVRGKQRALAAFKKGPGTIYAHWMYFRWAIDIIAKDGSVLLRVVDAHGVTGPRSLGRAMGISNLHHMQNVTDESCPLFFEGGAPVEVYVEKRKLWRPESAELMLRFSSRPLQSA